jgi:hypothetical protein
MEESLSIRQEHSGTLGQLYKKRGDNGRACTNLSTHILALRLTSLACAPPEK